MHNSQWSQPATYFVHQNEFLVLSFQKRSQRMYIVASQPEHLIYRPVKHCDQSNQTLQYTKP